VIHLVSPFEFNTGFDAMVLIASEVSGGGERETDYRCVSNGIFLSQPVLILPVSTID